MFLKLLKIIYVALFYILCRICFIFSSLILYSKTFNVYYIEYAKSTIESIMS